MKSIAVLVIVILSLARTVAMGAETEPAKDLEELRKQRLAAATELVERYRALEEHGAITVEQLRRAHLSKFEAALDMAESKQARLKLYSKYLKELSDSEADSIAREKVGFLSQEDVLKVKLERLELEVRMEKEKLASSTGVIPLVNGAGK